MNEIKDLQNFLQNAIKLGILDSAKIAECLKIQSLYQERGQSLSILEILLRKKYLTRQQIERIQASNIANAEAISLVQSLPKPEGEKNNVFGRYKILQGLGKGGMGVVYRAHDPHLQRDVALKIILQTMENVRDKGRFDRETRLMARLNHPNIIKIFDIGEEQGRCFFTMELIQGQSLAQLLQKNTPLTQLIPILIKVAHAIHYAHGQGVIHRDLKPSNIMVDQDNEPKVMDFGLAKELEGIGEKLSKSCETLGTPEYMSPEQAEASKNTDTLTDVYSLGVILYEILTGRPPFTGTNPMNVFYQIISKDADTPSSCSPNISKDLDAVCMKAIEKNKQKRYSSALLLAEDLSRYLEGKPVLAKPITLLVRFQKWVKRHRLLTVSSLSVFIATAALISFFMYQLAEEAKTQKQLKESAVQHHMNAEVQKIDSWLKEANAQLSQAELNLILTKNEIEKQNYWQAWKWFDEAKEILKKALSSLQDQKFNETMRLLSSNTDFIKEVKGKKDAALLQYNVLYKIVANIDHYYFSFFGHKHSQASLDNFKEQYKDFEHLSMTLPFSSGYVSQPSLRWASKVEGNQVTVWDIQENRMAGSFPFDSARVIAFSPDSQWIAVGNDQEEIITWKIGSEEKHRVRIEGSAKREGLGIRKLYFSPNTRLLCSIGRLKTTVWEIPSMKPVFSPPEENKASNDANCAFGSEDRLFALTNDNHRVIYVYSLSEPVKDPQIPYTLFCIQAVCFGPGDKTLITGGINEIRIHQLDQAIQNDIILPDAHRGSVKDLKLSDDGKFLASLGDDSRLVIWNTSTYRKLMEFSLKGNIKTASIISISSSRREVAIWIMNALHIYRWESKKVNTIDWLHKKEIPKQNTQVWATIAPDPRIRNQGMVFAALSLSPNMEYLAVYFIPYVYLWDIKQDQIFYWKTPIFLSELRYFSLSRDEKFLLWDSRQETFLWSLKNQREILPKHLKNNRANFRFQPFTSLLVGKTELSKIQFFKIESDAFSIGREIKIKDALYSFVFDSTGEKLGVDYIKGTAQNNILEIFELSNNTRTLFSNSIPLQGRIDAMHFCGDNEIALGNTNGDFIVYDWKKGAIVQEKSFYDPIKKIWFDPKEQLYWIQTQTGLFIYPYFSDSTFSETMERIYPLPIFSGYPIVAVDIDPEFHRLGLALHSGEIILVALRE